MRVLAGFYLTSGLFIIILTLAANSNQPIHIQTTTSNCLYCHIGIHSLTPQFIETAYIQPTTTPGQICEECHTINDDMELPVAEIKNRIAAVQSRVNLLREDLNIIYDTHPGWESCTQRQNKSNEQIMAEHIGILVSVIEADGSWGFHDASYTEQILTEAESLMADLLTSTGGNT